MKLKLIVKDNENDGRFDPILKFIQTQWEMIPVDFTNKGSLASAMATANAVISMTWTKDFPKAPNLKLLQLQGAGVDNIDLSSVPPKSYVCNVYEHEIGISEYVLGAILQWNTQINKHDSSLRNNNWFGSYLFGPPHKELYGQTIGIVGYGRIGKEVAKRAKAFGMNIVACTRTNHKEDDFVDKLMPMEELDQLLRTSDFVLLALPLDKDTENIIGPKQLRLIGKDGVIINVARGGLIDEGALYNACRHRVVGGAIIDTWYNYPNQSSLPQQPSKFDFNVLENIIMTPHSSAWTDNLIPRRCRKMARNLDKVYLNQKPINIVREPLRE